MPPDSVALRRARREFVRTQHPDRGGDATLFAEGLSRFDALLHAARHDQAEAGPEGRKPVTVLRRPHGFTGWAGHLTRLVVAALPGHRRPPRVH